MSAYFKALHAVPTVFQFFFTKTFMPYSPRKHVGADVTETDEYDDIFAALKHPVRRQILLFLEERGEASFTQIQNVVGIDDTGLMSYHLKELAPLVEQSERGKYRLSEVGKAGAELFQRVERERRGTRVTVRSEIENWLGETIVKGVLLALLLGFTWSVSVTVDILLSVQSFVGVSLLHLMGMFLVSLFGMLLGVVLFSAYYKHYHSKDTKENIKYTTIFATTVTIASSLVFYQISLFSYAGSLNSSGIPWQFGVLRAIGLMASAPAVAYAISKVRRR